MITKLYTEFTELNIQAAAAILRTGGLLGIPTETVYGLGANALDEDACRRIYEAKGRPQDNPLIIHVPDASWLPRYCKDVPEAAYRLAERFWPGPLTMILPKREIVPARTTGGLDTVAVRCPDHPVALALIRAADVPIAAPSGNTSGRPSPTSAADMLEDMDGKIHGIFDGGRCSVGVESTILDLTAQPPRLLRAGGLALEELRAVLGEVTLDKSITQALAEGEKPKAPGMKYRHYAPNAPVTVVTGPGRASAAAIARMASDGAGVICFQAYIDRFPGCLVHDLGPEDDKAEQARRVFDALREFDGTDVPEIFAQCPDEAGLGLAIGNRLKKAAGFRVLDGTQKLVVGITGGTGCGKTALLRRIAARGGQIIDCDELYAKLVARDEALRADLSNAFGAVFLPDGALDRKALAKTVFSSETRLDKLNQIIYYHVGKAVRAQLKASTAQLAAIDAINLLQSGLGNLCNVTVAVTAPEEVRLARIMARDGLTEEAARLRITAQERNGFFTARCDHHIDNGGCDPVTFEILADQLLDTIEKENTP